MWLISCDKRQEFHSICLAVSPPTRVHVRIRQITSINIRSVRPIWAAECSWGRTYTIFCQQEEESAILTFSSRVVMRTSVRTTPVQSTLGPQNMWLQLVFTPNFDQMCQEYISVFLKLIKYVCKQETALVACCGWEQVCNRCTGERFVSTWGLFRLFLHSKKYLWPCLHMWTWLWYLMMHLCWIMLFFLHFGAWNVPVFSKLCTLLLQPCMFARSNH